MSSVFRDDCNSSVGGGVPMVVPLSARFSHAEARRSRPRWCFAQEDAWDAGEGGCTFKMRAVGEERSGGRMACIA